MATNEDKLIEIVRDLIDEGVITVDQIDKHMDGCPWKVFDKLCDLLHKRYKS